MAAQVRVRQPRRQEVLPCAPRIFRERQDPLLIFRERQVRRKYRLWPAQIRDILELISNEIEPLTQRSHAISGSMKLCAALRFYACGTFHDVIGDVMGMSESSAWNAVMQVTDALLHHLPQFIHFPTTAEERARTKAGFAALAGFPGVIGAIDCTRVKIKAPSQHEHTYVNHHGQYTLNVQMVCDADRVITNVVANWPGGTHDAHIFASSGLARHLRESPLDGHLIGDSGYALRPYLLTPFQLPQTPAHERFNESHMKTRARIEQTYGTLKNRFAGLHSGLRCSVKRATKTIVVCSMLHNYCTRIGDFGEDFVDDGFDQPLQVQHQGNHNQDNHPAGTARRQHIVDTYFD